MNHPIKTTFAGDRHPITGADMNPKAKTLDADTLTICNDPLPASRARPGGKYDELLKNMKVGQCIKCAPDDIGTISSALRKWIDQHNIKATTRSMKNYGDGMGRVWMIALPPQALKRAA